jgi:hypothetical protein
MIKYYLFVTVVMLILVAVQSMSYDEYQRIEALHRGIGSRYPDGCYLSEAYRESISADQCLNSELPTTENPADHEGRITKMFSEILEEYATSSVGYGRGVNGGFTQYLLVHGRRENFTLGLEVVQESDGTYRLNGISGLCELLRDVNGFKAFAEGRECTLEGQGR